MRMNKGGMYAMNEYKTACIERFETLPSTQEYAKAKRCEGQDLIVIAASQTGGKGTKGRSFISDKGGVYLTKLSFYPHFAVKDAFMIMAQAAVAVCDTLAFYGLNPQIKWPNDIYVQDKKICGILIENVFSGNQISSSLVGIGINVCNTLPKELSGIAITMQELGKHVSVEEVENHLIEELDKSKTMEEYLAYVGYMGKQATLIIGDKSVHGTLLSVDMEGGLLVEIAGETRRLTAAEVSVRI